MEAKLALFALIFAAALPAAAEETFDPDRVDVLDAIKCRIDAPSYNGFALSIGSDHGIAEKRHWKTVKSDNPFMTEYELPAPITVAGHYITRRIAFTGTAIMAILDLEDTAVIAREEKIDNAAHDNPIIAYIVASGKASRAQVDAKFKVHRFLGERTIVDVTEPAGKGERFGTHTVIAHTISNAETLPGKTLYGCAYNIEVLDQDGKPL